MAAIWGSGGLLMLLVAKKSTTVTPGGLDIETAWLRHQNIPWSEVTAIIAPSRGDIDRKLRIRLADGRILELKNVPTARAKALAALAGAEVEISKTPPTPPRLPEQAYPFRADHDPDRPLTKADLDRRYAAFEARNRLLTEHLQPPKNAR